jgi:hypothetical protein
MRDLLLAFWSSRIDKIALTKKVDANKEKWGAAALGCGPFSVGRICLGLKGMNAAKHKAKS